MVLHYRKYRRLLNLQLYDNEVVKNYYIRIIKYLIHEKCV